jgi:hypothetical protein
VSKKKKVEVSKKKKVEELFLITYDQQKAYDSVQKFTIQASLERFNLPEKFISYVVSLLDESTSCFKTFYGPTDDFNVKTSVRQGDPLSPLVYILITDALHAGLKDNPLGPPSRRVRSGYRFSNDANARVSSSGYADDMLIFAQTWEGVWTMHQWVLEFCKVHYFKINTSKCRYIISNCSGESDHRWLPSSDGKMPLRPTGPDTVFRYLGIWLSMSLNWEKQIQVLNKRVMMWRSTVVRNRISSLKVATTVRDHLFPKLELGLQFAEISKETCNGWTKTIIHTVLENSGISALFARSINISAFCSLAGIPDIWRRAQTIRMTELYVALNTEHCDVGVTTRARYASLASLEGIQLTKAIATIQSKCLNNRKKWNRQAGQSWKDRGLT